MMNLCFLSAVIFQVVASANEVTYDIVVNKIEQLLTNNSIIDYTQLKLRKFNRTTQTWYGPFEAYIDMDNSVSYSLVGFKKTGNQWQPSPFRILPAPFCDYAKNEQYYFDIFAEYTDIPPKGSCPVIPKGKYFMKDLPVGQAKFPDFIDGEYWVQQKFTYRGEVVDELSIFCQVFKFQ